MAHFAILCPAAGGHVIPMGSLGHELQTRGHRITLVAREKAGTLARQFELSHYELPADVPPFRPPARVLRTAASLFRAHVYLGLRYRLSQQSESMLMLGSDALREIGVDGVIVDQNVVGGATVAERLGLPFITACSAVPWTCEDGIPPHYTAWSYGDDRWSRLRNRLGNAAWEWYMQPTMRVVNRYRRGWNMPPLRRIRDSFSKLAHLGQTCPEFDFPRRELADTFHYVGALAADRPQQQVAFPWERLDGRPLIYVTLGTVRAGHNMTVLRKIAEACAGLDVQVVISTGKWEEDEKRGRELDNLPGDPIVADFVPQLDLLDKSALLITHGGQNTVLEALTRSVPMIALPRGADQPAMAARIEHSGVGVSVPFYGFSARQLRSLIQRILTDPSYRERACQLREAMRATGGVQRAAEIAEQALTSGQPVPRDKRSEKLPETTPVETKHA
jgi:MGT family glycosyltransferase